MRLKIHLKKRIRRQRKRQQQQIGKTKLKFVLPHQLR
jgi:hypothetical protein